MKFRNNVILAFSILALMIAGCESEPAVSVGPRPTQNVLDIIEANGYTDFVRAVDRAGLRNTIESASAVTIFAPTNDAFNLLYDQLGVQGVDEIDAGVLSSVLNYHVSTEGEFTSADLPRRVLTSSGSHLYVSSTTPKSINSKSIFVLENRSGSNGIFHGINLVLAPPAGSIMDQINDRADDATPQFTLLKYALERAGLDDDLDGGDLTLFAPTDAAFTAAGLGTTGAIDGVDLGVLTQILNDHVLTSATFSVDLTTSRVATANGIPAEGNSIKGVDVNAATPAVEAATIQVINNLATNGTWHQVSALIRPKVAIKQGATTSATFGNGTLDPAADNFGLLLSAVPEFTSLDAINRAGKNSIYFPRVPPTVASFGGDNAAIVEYIERHIFPQSVNLSTAANGAKVTSIGGDEYYVATDASNVRFVNGVAASRNPFATPTTSFAAYDGTVFLWGTAGYTGLTPLPATNIVEMLAADPEFELFSAAIEVTGKDAVLSTGNRTLFAINDATFTAETGISDPQVLLDLDPEDEDDAGLIEALAEVIDRHTINSVYFWIHLNTVRPTIQNALDEEVFFGLIGGNTVIIEDDKDPENNFASITAPDSYTAKNGVVHVVDKIFEF